MAPKLDSNDFTPEKQRVYEEYMRTGKIDGEEIDNMFMVARKLNTSVSRINKWQFEQNKKFLIDKNKALHDLEVYQKQTESELITLIVKTALWCILAIFATTTCLYVFAMVGHYDSKIIEAVWGNNVAIIGSNCFSIIGTIMGVKYSQKNNKKKKDDH